MTWEKKRFQKRAANKTLVLIVLFLATQSLTGLAYAAGNKSLKSQGILVILDDRGGAVATEHLGRTAVEHATRTNMTVYSQLDRAIDVRLACLSAHATGLLGERVFIAQGSSSHIGLADNLADEVLVLNLGGKLNPAALAEAKRVLRPGGILRTGKGEWEWIKPFPEGMDDWSHHYHGPDNNPLSRDKILRWPYLTQFIADPPYGPAPQMSVASAGRLFMAFGHVAWHPREEPWLNSLIAINGFNGTHLWRRDLPEGHMVDRNMLIATPERLYLAAGDRCEIIDAKTGEAIDEITAPAGRNNGHTHWKWTALEDGILYAMLGPADEPDPTTRWRQERHGWSWNEISDGYNKGAYRWGYGSTLVAIDIKTKKTLWTHREKDAPIDSRGICMKNGKIFFCAFGQYLACHATKTGEEIWRKTIEKNPAIFEKIGPYRPGHGYVGGWKSTVFMKCSDNAVYFLGPQVERLTAFSAQDGGHLWTYNARDLHMVLRDEALYIIGPQDSQNAHTKKLDPLTGEVLESYSFLRRACTRTNSTPDSIFFRASGGTIRFDPAAGTFETLSFMRPSCHVGVLPANGHAYWIPWACDCNNMMYGLACLAPAGDFKPGQQASEQERLVKTKAADTFSADALEANPNDWPAYRRDSARGATTPVNINGALKLQWEQKPETPSEPTAPIAAAGLVFTGAANGVVRAFDAATSKIKWTAYAGGAVRAAPTFSHGRLFVGSADGWVYALDASNGQTLWRFRAAPIERRIPVYGVLQSTWPVSTGVLADQDTVYLAAGALNHDGTHLYALDAATGAIRWQNNDSGLLDSESNRGVSVQGDLLLHAGKLHLAGGNVISPAIFDAKTGRNLNAPLPPDAFNSTAPRGRELRLMADRRGNEPAQGDGRVTVSGPPLYQRPELPVYDGSAQWETPKVRTGNCVLSCELLRGDSGWSLIAQAPGANGKQLWVRGLGGEPTRWGMAVDAQGRVFITLRDGRILCFGV